MSTRDNEIEAPSRSAVALPGLQPDLSCELKIPQGRGGRGPLREESWAELVS